MDELLRKYERELLDQELSPNTIHIYIKAVKDFFIFSEKKNITKELLISYKAHLESKYTVNTVNLNIISLNKFLKFCGYQDCTIKTLKYQRRGSLENVIDDKDYEKLITYAAARKNKKYYMIIRTLAMTGIRINELRYVTVEAVKKGYTTVKNKGKHREIYFPGELQTILLAYCANTGIASGIIFLGTNGSAISREAVWRGLKRCAKKAGVDEKNVYPHSFRHHFALVYMRRYFNLTELADILGHSDLATTRIYTSSSVEDKRRRMGDMGL